MSRQHNIYFELCFDALALFVRTERQLRGITIEEAARAIGLNEKEYKKLEAADNSFSLKCTTIPLIASWCGLEEKQVASMVCTIREKYERR